MIIINSINISATINNMNIMQRKDDRFEAKITINGIRKSFYGNTKVEVKNKVKSYLQKINNGFKETKKIKLNDYVEYWLSNYKFGTIEGSSYTRLYSVYQHQIKPYIGNKYICDITSQDIDAFIKEFANPPLKSGKKPLALSGLKKILQLLNPCFETAIKEKIIFNNPCSDIKLPTESYLIVKTKEQFSLTDKQLEQFKKEAVSKYKTIDEYKGRDFLVLIIMLNLGLRTGEVLALTWDDFNFKNNIVKINKTIQTKVALDSQCKKQSLALKNSTKTVAGERYLKLNENTLHYIQELKQYDKRNNINSDYFCCCKNNTRQCARNLQRSLDRLTRNIKSDEHITLHTLRHTFGSTLLRNGVGIEVVSKLLGHANITITYNKYIHVIKEQEAIAMNMVKVC